MKGNLLNETCVALCIAISSTVCMFAGPIRPIDVPKKPAWVAHIDFDSVRSNAIGKFLLAEMDKPENQQKISALTTMFGLDIRTQIHGVTVYTEEELLNQPVLLIYGEFDSNRLTTIIKGAQEYDSMEHGKFTVHSWLDEKKKRPDGTHPRIYASLPNSAMIVFSPSRHGVTAGLDVLDKQAENLAANTSFARLLKGSDGKTFFQAAAPKMILPGAQAKNPIADSTTYVRLNCRTTDNDELTGLLTVGGKSEEVARSLASIAQGIVGLGKAQQEKPKLSELAGKVTVKQSGSELSVKFAAPSDEIIDLLKQAMAAKHK